MTFQIEPAEIERLVTGQLDAEEQACLLEWADDHPSNWRTIAAGFIAHQTLQRAVADQANGQTTMITSASQANGRGVGRLAFLACSLLLACSVVANGWQWVGQQDLARALASATSTPSVDSAASVDDEVASSASSPTYVVFIPGRSFSSKPSSSKPNAQTADAPSNASPQAASSKQKRSTTSRKKRSRPSKSRSTWDETLAVLNTPIVNAQSRQLFKEVGFEPIEQPSLYLLEDNAGRGYVIPQRHVTLRPVSHRPE